MDVCQVENCNRMLKGTNRNYCYGHYKRFQLTGDVQADKPLREFAGNTIKHRQAYYRWRAAINRCENPTNANYAHYGARGIKVSDEWKGPDGFNNFLEAMGDPPKGLTLDRINNDGNYEPGNCRWADTSTQAYNKRIRSTNTSGIIGVYWAKQNKKWEARLSYNYKEYLLGFFDDLEEAVQARKNKEKELGLI